MALPNLYYYYLARQLCHLTDWLIPTMLAVVESYLAYVLKIKHLLVALEAPLTALGERHIPILTLAHTVWRKAKRITDFKGTIVALSLWNNLMFPHLKQFTGYYFWERRGMVTLENIFNGNVLASFNRLQRKYELLWTTFHRYL